MEWPYVIVGYLIVLSSVGAYTLWLLARGRKLSADVPEERQRFLD
ncbi:MAG: hypothetical protein OER95_14340 [Acidimicrobiia bacterium]|nr:hypothetical protein [Acidimicrobiia bacterium]